MDFIVDNVLLLLVAVSSGAMLFLPVLRGATQTGLTPAATVQKINREKAVVIDVCEPEEFARGHLTGARNIPLNQLEDKLPTSVKNKSLPLILVCQTGARSARAVAIAKKLGYAQVETLGGGIGAWRKADLPIDKS